MGDCFQPDRVVGGDFQSEDHFPAYLSSFTTSQYPPEQLIGLQAYHHHVNRGDLSQVSAFDPPEQFTGFQNHDLRIDISPASSRMATSSDAEVQSYKCTDGFPIAESAGQERWTFQSRNSLQSADKAIFEIDQFYTSEKPYSSSCSIYSGCEHSQQLKSRPVSDIADSDARSYSFSANGKQTAMPSTLDSSHCQLNFSSQEVKRAPSAVSSDFGDSLAAGASSSSKTRMKWTPDLHDKFVECVNCLGGPDNATPKAIQELMNTEGLTIFQIKSHLQRYRITKYMPGPPNGYGESMVATDHTLAANQLCPRPEFMCSPPDIGKSESRISTNGVVQLDMHKTGMQLKETLQLQLDVQKRLHEQLEIQRKLQLKVEERGRWLKTMLDQQKHKKIALSGDSHPVRE